MIFIFLSWSRWCNFFCSYVWGHEIVILTFLWFDRTKICRKIREFRIRSQKYTFPNKKNQLLLTFYLVFGFCHEAIICWTFLWLDLTKICRKIRGFRIRYQKYTFPSKNHQKTLFYVKMLDIFWQFFGATFFWALVGG